MDTNSLALGIFFIFISIINLKIAIQKYKNPTSILPKTKTGIEKSSIANSFSKFSLRVYLILSIIFLIAGIILLIHGFEII